MAQAAFFDLRGETRPLRIVVRAAQTTETQWRLLLECGHSIEHVNHSRADAKRVRCTLCGSFGKDDNGLKYEVPE
jgi:hypothetical protein